MKISMEVSTVQIDRANAGSMNIMVGLPPRRGDAHQKARQGSQS